MANEWGQANRDRVGTLAVTTILFGLPCFCGVTGGLRYRCDFRLLSANLSVEEHCSWGISFFYEHALGL
jgi:hypothetical protein